MSILINGHVDRVRFERDCERAWDRGPRPLAELLIEIGRDADCPDLIAAVVRGYADLPGDFIRALDADKFAARFSVVQGGRR
jgi:hypothetical protein